MKIGQYINFIFFQRHIDPRNPAYNGFHTFMSQIEFVKRHQIPATFLLQYDVLCDEAYTDILKSSDSSMEIGGWFEIVQELAEDAGIKWRGREGYSWDWYANVGFSVGYTPDERRRLVDTYMKKYYAVFGCYPKSFGSWLIDAYTLDYMHRQYGVNASCCCRDQWGTDGYTLWGGYYGNAYYPSKNNVLCPADSGENQIDVPIFRMLGSDPIHQYDIGLECDENGELLPIECQGVATLEPYYKDTVGGGVPSWVDWYLDETFCKDGLGFHYTQAGQENSFPWDAVKDGLEYQIGVMKKMEAKGRVQFVTLGEVAARFRAAYKSTPATVLSAKRDWDSNKQRKTLWYLSKNYRLNVYAEKDRFWLRDLFLFDSAYPERYLEQVCESKAFVYDNLPIMDGNLWSGGTVRAGIYFRSPEQTEPRLGKLQVSYPESGRMEAQITDKAGQKYTIDCKEDYAEIRGPIGFSLEFRAGQTADFSAVTAKEMPLCHNDYRYSLHLKNGVFEKGGVLSCCVKSENGFITSLLGQL